MYFTSRAGLVAIFSTLIIAFTSAAPLPLHETHADSVALHHHSNPDVAPTMQMRAQDEREAMLVRRGHKATPAPAHPAPPHAAPPQHAAPQRAAPQHAAPQHAAAQRVAAPHAAPPHAAPPPPGASPPKHHMSLGAKIKAGFHKMVDGIKHVAEKAVHFMKTTGAKIAKVALKAVAVTQKLVSKVVGWIPGVGKPLGRAMDLESKGLDAASNAIHVKLPGKLEKSMEKMDKVEKVAEYIPRELDLDERNMAFEMRDDTSDALHYERWYDDDDNFY